MANPLFVILAIAQVTLVVIGQVSLHSVRKAWSREWGEEILVRLASLHDTIAFVLAAIELLIFFGKIKLSI